MNKLAIAMVALPLACLGGGYATGMVLAPPASESLDVSSEALDATNDAQQIAEGQSTGPLWTEDRTIIRLGQMTIPVEKANSVSYVVADFALKLENLELAERYKRVEDATRLRDSLLTAMNLAAEGAVLRGVSIDSDALSATLRDLLSKEYEGVEDVLFVSLYKQDVARL
ncbi:hypothetical protein SAMN04488040_3111 [Sulfitobacter marinus]|uniref:Flagellar protein FliL n=1 Tax=Sulfitobacter marinus TaxID=394264 RepID=A0A1I6V5Z2_9RHOB|nr:hypothetical protein [Sulfitobacter marinus]SFT09044.1 hypothetical protein SAMN04488040_3111 [Sulfitobacter marinus]